MKSIIAALILGLGLIGGTTGASQEQPQPSTSDSTPQSSVAADPSQFQDDICWVAPEWQDS